MYHLINDEPVPHVCHLFSHKSPEAFEADLLFLKRRFNLPTWPEFVKKEARPRSTGRPSLLITFDDGLSECFHRVRPLLLVHKVPCLFVITQSFVDNRQMFYRHKASLCIDRVQRSAGSEQNRLLAAIGSLPGPGPLTMTDFAAWMLQLKPEDESIIDRVCTLFSIDIGEELARRRPYMTSDEIRQLHFDGFTIGGHSVSHARLWELPADEIEREIVESCRFVQDLLGVVDVPFAFPFSADGVDRHLLKSIAERHPWISMMFATNGVEVDEPFIMNRINADPPPDQNSGASNLLSAIKTSYANTCYSALRWPTGRTA